ncbi:MAG: PilZ domain-containing protein [Polyangiaceae bacterium]
MHFEAMVAVGGAAGGAAFEAESMDVSTEGMRLRTAYLPEIGDQLVCRFDGPEGELIAIGEVTWATEQAKGGEFGVRFVDLDPETATALKELCAREGAEEKADGGAKPEISKGARVKLHIEGLGSPMKARVRSSASKEVCVGSSLEFLKLGRQVGVEDVDAGDRREGFVDTVKVEVDPNTSVPQLIVSLRFDGATIGGAMKTAEPAPQPSKKTSVRPPAPEGEDIAPPTKAARAESELSLSDAPARSKKEPAKPTSDESEAASARATDDDDDEMMMAPPNKLRAASEKAKELSSKAASAIGPAFSKLGDGAKGFVAKLRDTVAKRGANKEDGKRGSAPKRVTAPPPSGALTSDGRRLVRQGSDAGDDDAPVMPPKRSKKGVVIGAAAGLVLVLGIVGVSKAIGGGDSASNKPVASAEKGKVDPNSVPPIPGAPGTVNVPLFGPTPASTTEQVDATPPDGPSAKGKGAEAEEPAEVGEESEGSGEPVKEWGEASVHNPTSLKVKLDGPVEGFVAHDVDGGFSLTVPGRKSTMSSTSMLLKKDKRLAAVDVVNNEDGAEITIRFKGETPSHRVVARGDKIDIQLGSEGAAKSPSKKGDPKKVASHKPGAKPAAKPGKPGKPAAKPANKKKPTNKKH